MGEEYGERNPFQFFTDHVDPAVAEATREGRRREFAGFSGFAAADVPDPQDPETYARSRLSWDVDEETRAFYRRLLRLRRELPRETEVEARGELLRLRRGPVELTADFGARTVRLDA